VLKLRHPQRGVTLIELVVGMAITAMLLGMGAYGFGNWIRNTQTRTAAESILAGLQLARAEAVRRNTPVRFQLTTTPDNSCGLLPAGAAGGANWVVSQDDPTGACASAASDTAAPRLIQTRAAAEGSANANVMASQSVIVFTGLGRVTPVPAGDINIIVTSSGGGSDSRRLWVTVSMGGQVRMCDPDLDSSDPQGC
jgi:type IV fimbrial biogenesis protein FimT